MPQFENQTYAIMARHMYTCSFYTCPLAVYVAQSMQHDATHAPALFSHILSLQLAVIQKGTRQHDQFMKELPMTDV